LLKDVWSVNPVEMQNVGNMRRLLKIKVKYTSEDDGTYTDEDVRDEKKQVTEYLEELIDSDFHQRYKLIIKK